MADKSSDAINKAIEASSEAGDDGAEKSTNTINKVGEESIETGNSTAHASEEAKN